MMKDTRQIVQQLSASTEPSVRYLLQVGVLGSGLADRKCITLREEVRSSTRAQTLLTHWQGLHPYQKWNGAHWILSLLADLGYPTGNESLTPLRELELNWLMDEERIRKVQYLEGRFRRCASQEGNAAYSLLTLGLADGRVNQLVDWLLRWQWPDGGWNCDKHPEAHVSSFNETLIPLRGLIAYSKIKMEASVKAAADRAADVFLSRHIFRRLSDNKVIFNSFTRLHFPCFWHYDILFALKVMNEGGYLDDPRCKEALDLLESKQQENGGFPAEEKYYRVTNRITTGTTSIDWGPVSRIKPNEFVSVEALNILKKAGRF